MQCPMQRRSFATAAAGAARIAAAQPLSDPAAAQPLEATEPLLAATAGF